MLIKGKMFFLIILILFSCNTKHDDIIEYQKKYFKSYNSIFNICLDTLKKWENDSLESVAQFILYPYELDSSIIFNKDSNRLYTTLNTNSSPFKDASADNIVEFGGAKIGGKWYFFFGASLVVPREFYQDSIYSPLTFEELSGVAHRNYHQAALIQNADGSFKANEAFFDKYLSPLPNGSWENKPRNIVDSMIVAHCVEDRQQKIDSKEIAEIKAEMAASVRPKEPHYIKLTLQKWGDNIAHLFE